MNANARRWAVGVLCLLLLAACEPRTSAGRPGDSAGTPSGASAAPPAPKTLNVVLVGEPRLLTTWRESTTGGVVNLHETITNGLIGSNANSEPIPRLAAEVPSVDNGTWTINPDGSMDTTYRLQPNAVWHDGAPVTADDVVFSVRAQIDPRFEMTAAFRTLMTRGATGADALDDHTVVIHWGKPYGFAEALTFWDLTPLPAHILQTTYERDVDELRNHPYWSDESVFVGTGPYRLARWERGVLMDLQAFDRYYLGRAKIDRILVNFVPDNNTAIARVLAGDVDMVWGGTWDASAMDLVRGRGLGDFVVGIEGVNHLAFQFKDMAQPVELAHDVRLRRAIAYATDREAVNQVDADGMSMPADSWIPPTDPRYKAAEPFITKYPYDPERALAQFADAGWTKGADGMLRNASGQLFTCEFRGEPARKATQVITNTWRSVGIDAQIEERPENLARDLQVRATFHCVEQSYRPFGRIGVQHLHSNNAMLPERGWAGANRGSYMNPELDRLIDAFMGTTSDAERLQVERDMVGFISTELPILHTIYEVRKDFQKTGVTGIVVKTGLDIVDSRTWNVADWDKQ